MNQKCTKKSNKIKKQDENVKFFLASLKGLHSYYTFIYNLISRTSGSNVLLVTNMQIKRLYKKTNNLIDLS